MGDPLGAPMGDPVGASGSGNVALLSSPRQPQNRADQQDGTLGLVGPRTRWDLSEVPGQPNLTVRLFLFLDRNGLRWPRPAR